MINFQVIQLIINFAFSLNNSTLNLTYSFLYNFILHYGYLSLFILMLLESSSLPVPSEIVVPIAGMLSRNGPLFFPIALIVLSLGSIIGMLIDYYIGYFLGKDIVYKHLKTFHLKQEELDKFDELFDKNAVLTIFITRLIPVIRTFMSFPAGFAKMDIRTFLTYSILGIVIWNTILMLFGYYLITLTNVNLILLFIIIFLILLYIIYKIAQKKLFNK
ncbi:MAG: DedA family protein [Candidatus Micrarchaeia archaeon]